MTYNNSLRITVRAALTIERPPCERACLGADAVDEWRLLRSQASLFGVSLVSVQAGPKTNPTHAILYHLGRRIAPRSAPRTCSAYALALTAPSQQPREQSR